MYLSWAAVHPIRRHDTPSDRVYRDGTGVVRRNGCSASCSEPGGYFEVVWLRLMLPLGCVGRNCPQLCLLREAVHPIRRHDTPSDRVYRDVTGAARRNGCSATDRVQCVPCPVLAAPAREPELRASTAPQDFAGGQQTGARPKPRGSDPSLCRISAVISPRESCDDRRVHQQRSALDDGSATCQP